MWGVYLHIPEFISCEETQVTSERAMSMGRHTATCDSCAAAREESSQLYDNQNLPPSMRGQIMLAEESVSNSGLACRCCLCQVNSYGWQVHVRGKKFHRQQPWMALLVSFLPFSLPHTRVLLVWVVLAQNHRMVWVVFDKYHLISTPLPWTCHPLD